MSEIDVKESLKQLPLRAQVAFAARCARRAQPFSIRPDTASWQSEAIERAIRIAEQFARGNPVEAAAAGAASNSAANAAAYAADAAAWAANAAAAPDAVTALNAADAVVRTATDAAWAANAAAAPDAEAADAAARSDIYKLSDLKLGSFPALGNPIDPSESGPLGTLWPTDVPDFLKPSRSGGETTGIPEAQASEPQPELLVLEAEVNEFADTEEVAGALADLCYALNAYHIAAGGNGLVIDEWEIRVPSPETVEAR
jgi:hypothetical protein